MSTPPEKRRLATKAPPPVPTPLQPPSPVMANFDSLSPRRSYEVGQIIRSLALKDPDFFRKRDMDGTKSSSTNLAATQGKGDESFNPGQVKMPLEANSGVEQKFQIMLMTPVSGFAHQSREVTFIGSFADIPLACMFDDTEVPLQILQDNVLTCEAPPRCPGIVSVCFTSGDRKSCSEVGKFEYRDDYSSCPKCKKTAKQVRDENIELLALVRFLQRMQCDPSEHQGEGNGDIVFDVSRIPEGSRASDDDSLIRDILQGTGTLHPTLKELLKARLHDWLSEKYPARNDDCASSNEEENGAIDPDLQWVPRMDREEMITMVFHFMSKAGARA